MDTRVLLGRCFRLIAVLLPIPIAMLAALALGADLVAVLGVAASAAVAWVLIRRQRSSWGEVGLRRTRGFWRWPLVALGLAILLHVLLGLLTPAVLALTGESLDLSRFDVVRGNIAALLVGLAVVWSTAAFGEEMVFRGFVLNEISSWLGNRAWHAATALVATSVLFGVAHAYQGWVGVILTGFAGLFFGTIYLLFKRNLWVPILTHGIFDTLAFVAIYLSLDRAG
jgi:membrane protease YdiL (CAAX protease family)